MITLDNFYKITRIKYFSGSTRVSDIIRLEPSVMIFTDKLIDTTYGKLIITPNSLLFLRKHNIINSNIFQIYVPSYSKGIKENSYILISNIKDYISEEDIGNFLGNTKYINSDISNICVNIINGILIHK